MSSLHDLLTQEAVRRRSTQKPSKPSTARHSRFPSDPAVPTNGLSLCRDRRNIDLSYDHLPRHCRSRSAGLPAFFSSKSGSKPSRDFGHKILDGGQGANEEGFTVRAIVSVVSKYVGRFVKDRIFREQIRETCVACLAGSTGNDAHMVFVNMEMGIDNIERLVEDPNMPEESRITTLGNAVRILSIVASLNSSVSRQDCTCGVPNLNFSACAQLYLSVAYKLERGNSQVSAIHFLQVVCDAPHLARKKLLPDFWERFFLPHLLHLKMWYDREVNMVMGLNAEERNKKIKGLHTVFNDQMDLGTSQFAFFYRDLIKIGGGSIGFPFISLPIKSNDGFISGKILKAVLPSSVNKIHQTTRGFQQNMDDCGDGVPIGRGCSDRGKEVGMDRLRCKVRRTVHAKKRSHRKHPSHIEEITIQKSLYIPQKPHTFRLFTCRGDTIREMTLHGQIPQDEPSVTVRGPRRSFPLIHLAQAINLISTSTSLSKCEMAVHAIAGTWSDTQGDPIVVAALSTTTVIQSLLEISFTSKNDEILSLAISLLGELVSRNETNRQAILNADPQLKILLRLLRMEVHFLKVGILIYLLRPKAKHMLSSDWVPLVLRMLEDADEIQFLFSVQCNPKTAAFYLLNELLMGFDVDRNLENARQAVAIGGFNLLIRRLEVGKMRERRNAATLLATCVRADGSCREYLATNVNKNSILELLLENLMNPSGCAVAFLLELISIGRRTLVNNFLTGLKNTGHFNTMQILLVCLQHAVAEQRPLIASILLQLDLLGDTYQYSVYREEAIDFIVGALDYTNSKKIQVQCSQALLILGGRFSNLGHASSETWILKNAGFNYCPANLHNSKEEEEEKATESWLRNLTHVMLTRGSQRFLVALSNAIANGISCLARSCLVTVAWMSCFFSSLENASGLWSLAWSVLTPQLLESLKYDRALEERVLASFSLLNFAKNSEYLSKLSPLTKESEILLQDLTRFTWTAEEILFLAAADLSVRH